MKLTYKHTVLSCYMAYISSAAANNLPSLLFIIFQNDFGLTTTQLASLITFNFITQILVDVIGAKYSDKVGYRAIAVTSEAFLALGLVGIGIFPMIMGNKYLALGIASIVYAIGSGLAEVIISPMIEALPGDAKESAMSILHSFYCWGHVGVVVLSTLYFYVFGTDKWFILPILWAIAPIVTLLMFSVVPIRTLNDSAPSMPISQLFKTKIFWLFMLLMICGGAAEQAMAQWASLFAEAALGVSKTVGNLLGPCFFAIAMGVSRGLYGKYADNIPIGKALLICAIVAVCGYGMVSLIPNPYVALIGCGVIGVGVGLFWPGVLSVSSKNIPTGGTAMFAILAVCGDIGCSSGPQLAAVVSEIEGAGLSMGLLSCMVFPLIIAISMVFFLKNRKEI